MPTDLPEWVIAVRREVGHRIWRLRTERGMSQEQLAERAGLLDRKTISRAETGRHALGLDQLVLIAHALGVPPDRLLRDP